MAQSQLALAEADVTSAQAEATRREADAKRYASLDPRAVSQAQLDASRAADDSARAQLLAAQKRVGAATAGVSEAQAKVANAQGVLAAAQTAERQIAAAQARSRFAQAQVGLAQAQLDAAMLDLSYTIIKAPVAGRVTRKNIEPGQYLQVGQTLLAVVPQDFWVTANFKETQLTRMRVGQPVDIHVDAFPDHIFHGLSVRTINTGGTAHAISELRRPKSCGGRCLPRPRESSSDLQISHTTTIRIARQIRKTTPKSERIAAASFDAGSSTGTAEANNRSSLK